MQIVFSLSQPPKCFDPALLVGVDHEVGPAQCEHEVENLAYPVEEGKGSIPDEHEINVALLVLRATRDRSVEIRLFEEVTMQGKTRSDLIQIHQYL